MLGPEEHPPDPAAAGREAEEAAGVVLTLYGRRECHLCDEAREAILAMRVEFPALELHEVDIESDPRLHAAYLERIPVIEVEGEIVSELVLDRDQLRRRLDTVHS